MRAGSNRVVALLCRPDGVVLKVLIDELALGPSLNGESLMDLMAPSSASKAVQFFRKIQEADTVLAQRLRMARPRPISLYFYGHRTASGAAILGTTQLLGDASARGSAEILAVASHDLRNPIAGILASSRYLLEDASSQLNKDQSQLLESIESASCFLLRLLDRILELSEIESGNLRLDFQLTDILSLIEQSLLINRSLAQNKRIRLSVACDGEPPRIFVDAPRLGEVIDNLLTNAIKFSLAGGSIEVRFSCRKSVTAIAVIDEGPGIPTDELEQVFQPFHRVRTAAEPAQRGTGLGLAIAKRIVEGHGGEIDIKSRIGQGSTFTVLLPNSRGGPKAKQTRRQPTHLVAGGCSY